MLTLAYIAKNEKQSDDNENYDGKTYFVYSKENEDRMIMIDSIVNLDGTYSIWETNYRTGVTRKRRMTGVESYVFNDESGL